MPNTILVTYASRAGSTVGVAEAIGQVLAESGLPVEVRRMEEVTNLSPYGAVVAGSAIQGGKWLPEAMAFVRTNQAELRRKPFAAFLVCMTLAMPGAEKHRQAVTGWLEPVRGVVRPVSEGFFAGAFDLGKVPSFFDRLKFRVAIALGAWPQGDHRDWYAIRAWARSLAPSLVRGAGSA